MTAQHQNADDALRRVTVERTALGQYRARNDRGGSVTIDVQENDFTAVELLLAAIGACTINDVDHLTTRRAEPLSLEVEVTGDKVRDPDEGNIMRDLAVTYRASFPEGDGGDAARRVLPDAVEASHDRLCTVGRTVQRPNSIRTLIESS